MRIWSQKSVLIEPRTSLPKFVGNGGSRVARTGAILTAGSMHGPFSGESSRPHASFIVTVLFYNNSVFHAWPPIFRGSPDRLASEDSEEGFQRSIEGEVFA